MPHQNHSTDQRPFVPFGVDAGTWLGFERRIQERRFRALLATAHASLAAGDHAGARNALHEARTLSPESAELVPLEHRLKETSARERRRAPLAAALFVAGVALLLSVDAIRAPVTTPASPAAPAPVFENVPIPVSTSGTSGDLTFRDEPQPVSLDEPRAVELDAPRQVPVREVMPLPVPQPPVQARRPPPPVVQAAPVRETTTLVSAAPRPEPVAEVSPARVEPAPLAVAAAPPDDESLVSSTLQRYARAYTDLDARATRAVWPTVDERALANAFAGLSEQSIDFDDCTVVVRQAEADAVCRGTASYVTRVGSSSPHVEPRTWRFELSRQDDRWLIDTAVAQR